MRAAGSKRTGEQKRKAPETATPPVVLDTSALLAFIEDEAGADRVEEALKHEKILLPWPVLLEVHYISLQEEGAAEADKRYALIKQLKAEFLWDMDEADMLTAAGLKAQYRVSLANSLIAAFALRYEAVLMHKDPEYEALEGVLRQEALPYKTARD